MIDVLLAQPGSSVNLSNNWGQSALHHACWKGRLECAQRLMVGGADANAFTGLGETPAVIAVMHKNFDVAKVSTEENYGTIY